MNSRHELNGLFLLDKPAGPTSHDLVKQIRHLASQKSVGHTGTLDPLATGLMGILLGAATRLAPYLVKMDKVYTGVIVLGLKTDTDDVTGTCLEQYGGPWPEESVVLKALSSLVGSQLQMPPNFSAIKVQGQTAHKAARAGNPVELVARLVTAYELRMTGWQPPEMSFMARVSSGYYIRSLARDLGEALGLGGGALKELRRKAVGHFQISSAIPLPNSREELAQRIIGPREALPHLVEYEVGLEDARRLCCGQFLDLQGRKLPAGPLKIIGPEGELLALGEITERPSPIGGAGTSPQRPFLRPLRVFGPSLEDGVDYEPLGKEK